MRQPPDNTESRISDLCAHLDQLERAEGLLVQLVQSLVCFLFRFIILPMLELDCHLAMLTLDEAVGVLKSL